MTERCQAAVWDWYAGKWPEPGAYRQCMHPATGKRLSADGNEYHVCGTHRRPEVPFRLWEPKVE